MANLLVTGAAGFIGANFTRYWLGRHPSDRVLALDALTYAGNPASLHDLEAHDGYRFVHGDIRDRELMETLLREEHIDTIVHFAAESHVDRSILGPEAFIDTNVVGTHRLLEAARAVWLESDTARPHRFHHISTDEVYGDLAPDEPAFGEAHPYQPSSPYSASKAASDHLVMAYARTYGLEVSLSNCSNNYGPFQFPEKLVALVITHILDGKPVPVYGDGSNVRDWLYVEDHCAGIERVLKQGQPGRSYNIGGNEEHDNLTLVRRLCRIVDSVFQDEPGWARQYPDAPPASGSGCESLIHFVADRPGHDRRYAIDAARAEQELAFRPTETFDSGMGRTVRWYLENEGWWREVARGEHRDWLERQYGAA